MLHKKTFLKTPYYDLFTISGNISIRLGKNCKKMPVLSNWVCRHLQRRGPALVLVSSARPPESPRLWAFAGQWDGKQVLYDVWMETGIKYLSLGILEFLEIHQIMIPSFSLDYIRAEVMYITSALIRFRMRSKKNSSNYTTIIFSNFIPTYSSLNVQCNVEHLIIERPTRSFHICTSARNFIYTWLCQWRTNFERK